MKQMTAGGEKSDSERVKLAFKMFQPTKLQREMSFAGEEELNEGGYEDLEQTQKRINSWLQRIGNL